MKLPWRRRGELSIDNSVVLGSVLSIADVTGDVAVTFGSGHSYMYWCQRIPRSETLPAEKARKQASAILQPRYAVAPVIGRDGELDDLLRWMNTPEPLAVRLIHASGGQGKTRLVRRLCELAAPAGWVAWRAFRVIETVDRAGTIELTDQHELLLVVDDAHQWGTPALKALLDNIHSVAARSDIKIRVLLLARATGFWWASIATHLDDREVAYDAMELAPLGLRYSRRQVFDSAVGAFVRTMYNPPPHVRQRDPAEYRSNLDLSGDRFESVLSLHMAALAAIHARRQGTALTLSSTSVSAYLLQHEYADWNSQFDQGLITTTTETLRRVVYLAILTGGLARADARSLLTRVIGGLDFARLERIIDDHGRCYSAPVDSHSVLTPLQPDQLGEAFISLIIPGHPEHPPQAAASDPWVVDATHRLLAPEGGTPPQWAPTALTRLVEAAERWPHITTNVLCPVLERTPAIATCAGGVVLARLADLTGMPLTILRAIRRSLTDSPSTDPDMVAAVQSLDEALLPQRIADSDEPVSKADLSMRYATRLDANNLPHQALEVTRQAIRLYRTAPQSTSASQLAKIARAEIALSRRLNRVGRPPQAVKSARKAVALYRLAVEQDSSTHISGLAEALDNLATCLEHARRPLQALDPALEAVEHYRDLAATDSNAAVANLASTLSNLSAVLVKLERLDEAVKILHEAIALDGQQLGKPTAAVDVPNYARRLTNVGELLGRTGHPREGIEASREAVALQRQLAERDPRANLHDLASSLMNLGRLLGRLGQPQEALDATQEAVDLRRRLADIEPDTYTAELAQAVHNLSIDLTNLGKPEQALDAAREAVGLYRSLTKKKPQIHIAALAKVLFGLANRLGDLGQAHKALEPAREAVAIYRRLVKANTDIHLPELAVALSNLSVWLGTTGQAEEALENAQESVALLQRLSDISADAYLADLAHAMGNAAVQLNAVGRPREALETVDEAIVLGRRLVEKHGTHVPRLARMLWICAEISAQHGLELPRALSAISEAIKLYENLADQVPAAFDAQLATARAARGRVLQRLSAI
ncbi:tetratricopeptide repeat protein [Nocardia nepalensis]|uniref:tetratricopeptide repeat protein n=1 Tax=Nocardia nepalensis TaxID=3375448 RepID=UPI003B67A07E